MNETRRGSADTALLLEIASLKEQLRLATLREEPSPLKKDLQLAGSQHEKYDLGTLRHIYLRLLLSILVALKLESVQQVLECKEALLREAERELTDSRSIHLSLKFTNDDLLRKLAESIQVNNELVEKMAYIAELQQLDTLRGRLASEMNTSPNIELSPNPPVRAYSTVSLLETEKFR